MLEESLLSAEKAINLGTNLPLAYYIRCYVRNKINLQVYNYGLDDCQLALKLNAWKKDNFQFEDAIDEEKIYNLIGTIFGKLGQHKNAIDTYQIGLELLRKKNANSNIDNETKQNY